MMTPVAVDHSVSANIYSPPLWLAREATYARAEVAFGLFSAPTTHADDVRLDLLSLWWLSGSSGCLFREAHHTSLATERLRAQGLAGLELCAIPVEVLATPWFAASTSAGFALAPLLLVHRFPRRQWQARGALSIACHELLNAASCLPPPISSTCIPCVLPSL